MFVLLVVLVALLLGLMALLGICELRADAPVEFRETSLSS
jgi:hypothetical protein